MQKEGLQGGRRAAGEAGGEVRHTHFVYKRNARAGKWRKRAEGGEQRAAERKQREGAVRKRREEAEGGSSAEAEGGADAEEGSGGRSLYGLSGVERSLAISFPAMKRQRSELCGMGE